MQRMAQDGAAEDVSNSARPHCPPDRGSKGFSHPVKPLGTFYGGDHGIQRVHGNSLSRQFLNLECSGLCLQPVFTEAAEVRVANGQSFPPKRPP
jgi:hypothetical protein